MIPSAKEKNIDLCMMNREMTICINKLHKQGILSERAEAMMILWGKEAWRIPTLYCSWYWMTGSLHVSWDLTESVPSSLCGQYTTALCTYPPLASGSGEKNISQSPYLISRSFIWPLISYENPLWVLTYLSDLPPILSVLNSFSWCSLVHKSLFTLQSPTKCLLL